MSNFDTVYDEDDLISDEREIQDELNRNQNDQSPWGELGYEGETLLSSAHSKRSRKMAWEYANQWE